HAEVLRGVSRRQDCRTTGATIALDAPPPHPQSDEAAGRARILHPPRHPRTVEQARAGAPTSRRTVRTYGPEPARRLTTGETNSSPGCGCLQRRLRDRVPWPSRWSLRG